MEFAEVVKKRFMCRSYQDRDVPEGLLDRILDLAVRFPSAGNTQPQEFIVIRSEDTKYQLARAALDQSYIDCRGAGGDRGRLRHEAIEGALRRARQTILQHRGGAFASLLLMLAAIDEGLGAAFVGAFNDDEVRAVLGLPKAVRPIGIIPIGVCAEPPQKVPRFSKEQVIHYERWKDRTEFA